MKTIICLCVPMDNEPCWELFRPFVQRFTDTLRQFDPGCEYELAAIVNSRAETLDDASGEQIELVKMMEGLPWIRWHYRGAGADIGSFQWFAKQQTENAFMVCCVTRVYFWKAGWLLRLVDSQGRIGLGLYGTSSSKEGGRTHVCTRCYAMCSEEFKNYPHEISSRDQGVFFEVGNGCLTEWFTSHGKPAVVVTWSGGYSVDFKPFKNTFRNGDQSDMLVFDKHSDSYREADETEKCRLEALCFGVDPSDAKA